MPKQDPTNADVLSAVKKLDQRFDKLEKSTDQRFSALETKTDNILTAINDFATDTEKRFQGIENRFGTMETKVTRIDATMVTKDYLDDKLADLRGDLVVIVRKEDTKVSALLKLLQAKKLLSPKETGKILSMEPFPQLHV